MRSAPGRLLAKNAASTPSDGGCPEMSAQDRPNDHVPDFASVEEEAEFWDTHEITDFLDDSWPVTIRSAPFPKNSFRLPVVLDLEDWRTLDHLAKDRGVETVELAAQLLTAALQEEQAAVSR